MPDDRNSITLDDDEENRLISELVNLHGAVKTEDPWPGRRSDGVEVAVPPVGGGEVVQHPRRRGAEAGALFNRLDHEGGEHHRLALEPMAGGDLVRVAVHLATRHVTLS